MVQIGDAERRRNLGADTGDKICTKCGKVLSAEEVEKIRQEKQI
jgi:hypothetical protein